MFYFLLHIPLIHLLAVIVCYARYRQAYWMFESPDVANFPFTQPPGGGFPLPVVYLNLGVRGRHTLSGLPQVRSPEAAPQRSLA